MRPARALTGAALTIAGVQLLLVAQRRHEELLDHLEQLRVTLTATSAPGPVEEQRRPEPPPGPPADSAPASGPGEWRALVYAPRSRKLAVIAANGSKVVHPPNRQAAQWAALTNVARLARINVDEIETNLLARRSGVKAVGYLPSGEFRAAFLSLLEQIAASR